MSVSAPFARHPGIAGATALVTGGDGFIGRHLVDALVASGALVTVVDALPGEPRPGVAERRSLAVGTDEFGRFLRGVPAFDLIFHLAGSASVPQSVIAPVGDFEANLATTLRLLEQLRERGGRTHLLFASSAAVYGDPVTSPIEESDPTVPVSPYGVSKLAAERYIAVYARLYGTRASTLRMFSVFGPGQGKLVVYDLLRKLRDSPEELVVHGDGTQARDFVYIGDAVRAFLRVAERGPADGRAYNVATGTGTSTAELAREVVRLRGGTARITFSGTTRPGDPERWIGSPARLRSLGWEPGCTLRDGLRSTAEWFDVVHGPARAEAALT